MRGQSPRGERGQATVEFSLIIPILILVIVGLIEFGKAFNYWISLNNISSDGARWAAVGKLPGKSSATIPQIKAYIASQFLTGELKTEVTDDPNGVKICATPVRATGPRAGDAVTVRITAPHTIGLVFTDAISVDLTGRSSMRLEYTPTDPPSAWNTGC